MAQDIVIGGRLHSAATGNTVAGANEILDDAKGKKQNVINQEVDNEIGTDATAGTIKGRIKELENAVGDGGSVDERIAESAATVKSEITGDAASDYNTLGKVEDKIQAEASRAEAAEGALEDADAALDAAKANKATTLEGYGITDAYTKSETYTKTEVNGLVDTPHQNYVTVLTYAALLAIDPGSTDTIYRVSNYDGSVPQVDVTKYSEYAWDGTQYVFLCVKSQIDEVFDISVYNNNATYADLAAALGTGGVNVPSTLRRGGMSVKFVQTSDNKYVQFFCTANEFTTNVNLWRASAEVGNDVVDSDFAITDDEQNAIVKFSRGHVQTKNFDSSVDASEEHRGLMSSEDKTKLNSVESGAEANDVETMTIADHDFDLQDGHGNAVAVFNNGHVKTKEFDSSDISNLKDNVEVTDIDFALMDNNNNAIGEFLEGHIKTKNFDSRNAITNIGIRGTMGSYSGYTQVSVGAGKDYATVQEAINSITDARIDNQYIIVVYDDFYVDDITDLYLDENRSQKVSSVTDLDNGKTCAYIFTKDFVHLIGKGKRRIHVNIPQSVYDDGHSDRKQYVHHTYWKGYCNIENLELVSQNTRYVVHSEGSDYRPTKPDYCVIKNMVDTDVVYIGNGVGSGYEMALGVGTGHGQKMYIKGCKLIGLNKAKSGYAHTHPYYTFPTTLEFDNTIFVEDGSETSFNLIDLFSGQNNRLIYKGCDTKNVGISYNMQLPYYQDSDFDMRHTRTSVQGCGNKTRMGYETWSYVLKVVGENNGDNITDISGTAMTSLFKDFIKKINGGAGAKSYWVGCLAHNYAAQNTWNQNYSSIGYNLGDCSSTNKALTITVGEHTETITFDKNYGGLVSNVPTAYYSDDDIIAEINSQLQYCQIVKGALIRRIFFDDEVERVYNNSDVLISIDKAVTTDITQPYYNNAVKLTANGDDIRGVSAEAISPHSYGYIIKKGYQRLWLLSGNGFGLSDVAGKYYAAGANGTLIEVQSKGDAFLYGTDSKTLDWV